MEIMFFSVESGSGLGFWSWGWLMVLVVYSRYEVGGLLLTSAIIGELAILALTPPALAQTPPAAH